MDDISRELPPDDSGAAPVSAQQKGPEELVRFERGLVGDDQADESLALGDRLAGMGAQFLADRVQPEPVEDELVMASSELDEPLGDAPGADEQGSGHEDADHQDSARQDSVRQDSGEQDERAEQEADEADGQPAEPEDPATAEGAAAETDLDVETEQGVEAEPVDQEAQVEQEAQLDEEAQVDQPEQADEPEAAEAEAPESDEIDAEAAQAAVAAEAGTASVERDLDEIVDTELGDDGLPIVPELTDATELSRTLFVLMLTSRDGMTIFRLAQACNTSQKLVEEALDLLQGQLRGLGLPVELTRVGDTVRWMSTASAFPYLQRLKGVKKLERLSPAALETLAVIAYRQPVMRSEIEAIRGVKAGPMLRTLLQHKLVKVAGRADVPGRPLQYGTTPHFLERFGLESLQDLPSVKEWKNLG
jgi:segregation and condensation protein B